MRSEVVMQAGDEVFLIDVLDVSACAVHYRENDANVFGKKKNLQYALQLMRGDFNTLSNSYH